MHIILVNDDGISSPFLPYLVKAAKAAGHRVTVCAPASQQSAKAHAFSIEQPVLAKSCPMEDADEAWAIEGTPVDCARIGMMSIAPEAEAVISGINLGYNVGLATYVSGTVGAAREAVFMRRVGVAVSTEKTCGPDTLAWLAAWAVQMAERLVKRGAPDHCVCNLNAPPIPASELREPKLCPLNRACYLDGYERRVSPRGQTYFWVQPIGLDVTNEGSDQYWLDHGHPTCTFLTIDGAGQEQFASYMR